MPPAPTCPTCGYSLITLPDRGRCPECGAHYDPVILAYAPDPAAAKRNQSAWAAVLLPVITAIGVGVGVSARGSFPSLVGTVVVAVILVIPLTRVLLGSAPFHPSGRLIGASFIGTGVVLAGYMLARAAFGGAVLIPFFGTLVGAVLAPLIASAYLQLGARIARRRAQDEHDNLTKSPSDAPNAPSP